MTRRDRWARFPSGLAPGVSLAALLSLGLLPSPSVGAAGTSAWGPVAVSPGDTSEPALVEDRCPSFSWSLVPDAVSYELVVYRVGRKAEEPEPVLQESLPAAVSSWTPSLDRCLVRGLGYAWTVRAVGASGVSAWSEPRLFAIDAGPSLEELEEALEVIRRYAEAGTGGTGPGETESGANVGSSSGIRSIASSTVINTSSIGTAALTVTGEVRTLEGQFGEPRQWGRGRKDVKVFGHPGVLGGVCFTSKNKFGLSHQAVDWGSAADACPAGTWVCMLPDVAVCDTDRTDIETVADARSCDGTARHFPPNDHRGWVSHANFASNDGSLAIAWPETDGTAKVEPACTSLPVWCCWE